MKELIKRMLKSKEFAAVWVLAMVLIPVLLASHFRELL
tara:strand:- start:732 stop:845 length:114 start_codon:yes stop_codon:yes gene_type:complete